MHSFWNHNLVRAVADTARLSRVKIRRPEVSGNWSGIFSIWFSGSYRNGVELRRSFDFDKMKGVTLEFSGPRLRV